MRVHGSQPIRLVAALVLVLTALSSAASPAQAADPDWLRHVNAIRTANGLQPVSIDTGWTDGIRRHLDYLDKTASSLRTGEYASAHTENPASPYYSASGALEGSRSNLVSGGMASDVAAVNIWLGAPFHAIGMLRPALRRVALYRDPTTGAAGMDVIGGLTGAIDHTKPIVFPAPGTTTNLYGFRGEFPDPIETCRITKGWSGSSVGLPLVALLTVPARSDAVATLTGPDGRTVSTTSPDLCLVTDRTYRSTDPVYGGTGQQILAYDNAALIIARRPLSAGTYTATISQSGISPFSWGFTTTASETPVDPGAEQPSEPTGFVDVSASPGSRNFSRFADEIRWMSDSGVSTGWATSDGVQYRPRQEVTREAMAAFLYRASGRPPVDLPRTSPFADVPTTSRFYREIVWLADQGVSRGWDVDGRAEFRPSQSITREAMAAFLYRLAQPTSPAPGVSPFADVTPRNTEFFDEIVWMATAGISTGTVRDDGSVVFQPRSSTRRDAMAAFLYRFSQ